MRRIIFILIVASACSSEKLETCTAWTGYDMCLSKPVEIVDSSDNKVAELVLVYTIEHFTNLESEVFIGVVSDYHVETLKWGNVLYDLEYDYFFQLYISRQPVSGLPDNSLILNSEKLTISLDNMMMVRKFAYR